MYVYIYAQCSVFKHRKIIKKGAAAVTTMPGIYLTNYTVGLKFL